LFRIEAFVEDKRLGEALRALAGLARGLPSVTPVANIEKGGKGAPKAATSGSTLAMFEKYIHSRKSNGPLRSDDIRNWLKAHGMSPSSKTYLVNMAIKHGLLRRTGKSTNVQYTPIHKKG
jgi:hypothetical protein